MQLRIWAFTTQPFFDCFNGIFRSPAWHEEQSHVTQINKKQLTFLLITKTQYSNRHFIVLSVREAKALSRYTSDRATLVRRSECSWSNPPRPIYRSSPRWRGQLPFLSILGGTKSESLMSISNLLARQGILKSRSDPKEYKMLHHCTHNNKSNSKEKSDEVAEQE